MNLRDLKRQLSRTFWRVEELSPARRCYLALALPLVALGLQHLAWPWIHPLVWFFFFPAVFFSARLGGFWCGIASTLLSVGIVVSVFMTPMLAASSGRSINYPSVVLFMLMGVLFSDAQQRLRRSRENLKQALADTQLANSEMLQLYHASLLNSESRSAVLNQEIQRYEQIVANSSTLLGFVDTDFRYVVANPAYARLLNATPDQLRGQKVVDIIGAQRFLQIGPRLERAMAGEAVNYTTTQTFSDGQMRVLEADYQPYVANGKVEGVVVNVRDITALHNSEEALKQSEERFRMAIDASNEGLWDWDLRTGLAYLPPRYYAIIGYSPAGITPDVDFYRKTIHPEDLARVMQVLGEEMQQGGAVTELEYRIVTAAGAVKWIKSRGTVIERDADGLPLRMLGTIVDITEDKAAKAALRGQADELAMRNVELERFNRATVGREIDMIALKQKVNALCIELGRAAPYARVDVGSAPKPPESPP